MLFLFYLGLSAFVSFFFFFFPFKESESVVTQSCPTLCNPMDCGLPGFSGPGDSPGKNTGVGYYDLLQGISPTQGSNTGLPHCTWILYRLNHHKTTLFLRGIQHVQRNEWVYPEDLMYSTVTILNNTLFY